MKKSLKLIRSGSAKGSKRYGNHQAIRGPNARASARVTGINTGDCVNQSTERQEGMAKAGVGKRLEQIRKKSMDERLDCEKSNESTENLATESEQVMGV